LIRSFELFFPHGIRASLVSLSCNVHVICALLSGEREHESMHGLAPLRYRCDQCYEMVSCPVTSIELQCAALALSVRSVRTAHCAAPKAPYLLSAETFPPSKDMSHQSPIEETCVVAANPRVRMLGAINSMCRNRQHRAIASPALLARLPRLRGNGRLVLHMNLGY
jgi:hypothetical protein